MFVGVSSLLFLFHYLSCPFNPDPVSLTSLSLSLLFHPSPFINHQQPVTAHQCFKCHFLLFFRKTYNYHFSLSDFPLCFVSIDVCPFRAALH